MVEMRAAVAMCVVANVEECGGKRDSKVWESSSDRVPGCDQGSGVHSPDDVAAVRRRSRRRQRSDIFLERVSSSAMRQRSVVEDGRDTRREQSVSRRVDRVRVSIDGCLRRHADGGSWRDSYASVGRVSALVEPFRGDFCAQTKDVRCSLRTPPDGNDRNPTRSALLLTL